MAFSQTLERAFRPQPVLLSALFSLWVYVGLAITRTGSAFSYLHDPYHIVLSVLVLLICWAIALLVIYGLFQVLDRLGAPGKASQRASSWQTTTAVFVGILLCWTPYLVVSFPGLVNFDYLNQLNQFVGARPLSNHHPVSMTFFLGALYELGHRVGGASGGLYLTVLTQALCLDGLFCYLHRSLCNAGVRRAVRVTLVVFCCLCPIFPLYACILVKDTFSAIALGLFSIQIANRTFCEHVHSRPPRMASLPAITASGVLCSLTRANCIYLVLAVLVVCLFVLVRTRKLAVLASALVVALVYFGWTNVLVPALGATPSDTALVISIPLQQTGAFARDAADEATEEERAAIEGLLGVSYDTVGQLYAPNIVDPLQTVAKNQADDHEKLEAYLGAWISQGLRRPDIYLDALLRANVGYWFPHIAFEQIQDLDYTQNTPASHIDIMRNLGYAFSGDLSDIDTAVAPFEFGRNWLQHALILLSDIPVLGLVLQPGFYTWACLLVGVWTALRHRHTLPLLALAILLFLVECVSPLAASMRYALPMVVLTPIILGMSLAPTREPRHIRTDSHS